MSYEEEDELGTGLRSELEEDEPLEDIPAEGEDFGLEEEDPDKDS